MPDLHLPLPPEFKMWREFKAFLLKQNVLALALAVVVGSATNSVVQGIVNDFIMPVVTAVTPTEKWQTATVDIGRVHFAVGHFASVALNFIIISFVAWQLTKFFLKPQPVTTATQAMRQCPYCKMQIDARATRCPYCTSEVAPVNQ
ncbi:MAG TPA: MscL family protein [Gemmatimonadaceae bacterium]